MLNDEQKKRIDERVLYVCDSFLTTGYSINELSSYIGIPSSTIQRDLTSIRVKELLGDEIYEEIQELFKYHKQEGTSLGGYRATKRYEQLRDTNGRFSGNKKR